VFLAIRQILARRLPIHEVEKEMASDVIQGKRHLRVRLWNISAFVSVVPVR
jgi:hypothetical protein